MSRAVADGRYSGDMPLPTAPDVLLLSSEWPDRALLRAQLLEDGYEVVAFDAWPIPELYAVPGMKPRLALIDLRGLPEPRETLEAAVGLFGAESILVLTALGTMRADEVERLGVRAIGRPASVGQIVAIVSAAFARRSAAR